MKVVCRNENCSKFNIEMDYVRSTYKFVDGKLVSNNIPCPTCGKDREDITEVVPLSEKDIKFGKYSSSSPEEKKKMLKKRSQDHFEKEIKPYKEHKLQEAVKSFKSASKG